DVRRRTQRVQYSLTANVCGERWGDRCLTLQKTSCRHWVQVWLRWRHLYPPFGHLVNKLKAGKRAHSVLSIVRGWTRTSVNPVDARNQGWHGACAEFFNG